MSPDGNGVAMKILLVRVPIQPCDVMKHVRFSYFAEPTGLHCLAGGLDAAGMESAVHDMFLDADPDSFMATVAAYRPDVIGFSSQMSASPMRMRASSP